MGSKPFEIPSIHYLTLRYHKPQYASALIQHFYFANLCVLTLDLQGRDYTSFVKKLLVHVKGWSKSIFSGVKIFRIFGSWLPCDITTVEVMFTELTTEGTSSEMFGAGGTGDV